MRVSLGGFHFTHIAMPRSQGLLLLATMVTLASCSTYLPTRISGKASGARCVPVLPGALQRVLYSEEASFELWKPRGGDCSDTTYGLTGDFNADGRIDVVLNGKTLRHAIVLVLLSGPSGYEVQDARRAQLVRVDGVVENWTDYSLRLVKPGRYEPSCASGDSVPRLDLRTDAFSVSSDKSLAIAYLRDGRFTMFPWATC